MCWSSSIKQWKKIIRHLKMPISTVRALTKKFKTTRAVINLYGRGWKFIFPQAQWGGWLERQTFLQWSHWDVYRRWYHYGSQCSKYTIRHHLHANKLSGSYARKKSFLSFILKHISVWSSLDTTWSRLYGLEVTQSGFGVKRSMGNTEKEIFTVTLWEKIGVVVGLFFLLGPR